MSYEAWGDDDDGLDMYRDGLLDDGWWTNDQVDQVKAAITALFSTQIYEARGQPASGVSVEFLMRMNILRYEAGLAEANEPVVVEALGYFEAKETAAASAAKMVQSVDEAPPSEAREIGGVSPPSPDTTVGSA